MRDRCLALIDWLLRLAARGGVEWRVWEEGMRGLLADGTGGMTRSRKDKSEFSFVA